MAQKKGNRIFVWIIMILLFIGLLGFGTGGLGGNIRSIGSAGDKDISVASYQRTLTEQIRALEAQLGTRLGFQQAQALGIDQAALGQLITTRTLDNETSQLGVSIGDERVREEVLRVPAFRGLDGNFDREAYRLTLSRNGQTETEFETSIRDEISRTLLQGAVVGGIPGPDAFAEALVSYIGEKRDVVFATVTRDALEEPVPGPTEAQIAQFYDDNPDQFTAPEQRDISFAWLTPEMIQDTLEVDETAIRELYDERSAEFIRPERRLVERLIYIDMAAAQTAIDRLNAGEVDFEGLVEERGLALADVDMGDVAQTDLGPAGEAVFAAAPGDVVGPLNSSLGPALFRMNAVLAAEEVSFEDAAPQLRDELSADRARRVIADAAEGLVDLLAGGATVADLAAQSSLEQGQISWDADTTEGIAAYEAFRTAAANAEIGAFPELVELEDGGVFALELTAVTPPAVKPLEDVVAEVRTAWIDAKRSEMIREAADALAAQIQPLTSLESLGLSPVEELGMTRRSFVEGTPPGFALEVFEMDPGEIRVIDSGANSMIIRLNRVGEPDPEDPAIVAEREALAETAANGIAQDIFAAFAATVQNRTDIVLDQSVLNAIHAQLQ